MSNSKELSSQLSAEDEYSLSELSVSSEMANGYKNAISNIHPSLLQSWLYYQLKKCENIREFEQKALKTIERWCNFILAMKYLAAIFSCGIVLLVDYISQRYQHNKNRIWYGASPFLKISHLQAELSSHITSVNEAEDKDLYFTQPQIYKKISAVLSPVKNPQSSSTALWEKFAFDLLFPLKDLYVHAIDLSRKQKKEAENKSTAILNFIEELWNIEGKTEHEKICAMRSLVEEVLKSNASDRHPLLINRGLNLYRASSGAATFFNARCYKMDFQNKRYYVSSTTEHLLVQLYYVLSLYSFVYFPMIGRSGELLGASPQTVNYLFDNYENKTEHLKI